MDEKRSTTVSENVPAALSAVQVAAAGSSGNRAVSVESIGHKLWRGKWLWLSTVALFSLIAMMLGTVQAPLYKEQTSVEVQGPDGNGAQSKPYDQDSAHPLESFLQTQIRIIESRSLLERALAKLSDAERARLLESPHFWWTRTSYDQSVESIRQHISAQPSEHGDIIDVSFLSPDAGAGAHFLNILTQELADSNVERTWRAVQHNRQFAERQIDDLRRKWEQSEQILVEYSHVSGLPLTARSPNALKQTRLLKVAPYANDANLRQLRTQLADLRKQISQWQTLYGKSGAEVQKLRVKASETEAAIRQRRLALQQTGTTVSVATPLPESTTSRPQGASYSQVVAHLDDLQQQADTNRSIYDTAVSRLKQASIAAASQLGDISVVDPAIPVMKSNTPGQFVTGTLGGFVGLMVGIAFVALRDRFSNTFSDPSLLSQYLGLPVLGAIPVDRFAQNGTTYDAVNQEPALQINFSTDLRTAEAFRSIRSSILLSASQRTGPRRIVFTSTGSAEGTTFVVGNLGAALASAQRRVLLVDGNLRSPGLHKIFGADNEHGLAELLSRQIPEHPVTSRDVIRETQIPDLYLLTAGQAGARAPEILSSVQLPQMIREFAKGFDLVLVDSPPVLPYADARSLARAVDGVVLIVKACSTDRHLALKARDVISQDGASLIGAILTEWDAAQSASA